MRVVLKEDIGLTEDSRLIRRLYKVQPNANFPDGLKFAYQYLLLKEGEWLEACRIDNYRHDKKKTGTHMHKYGSQFVEFRELSSNEAESASIEIGNLIKAAIKGEQNGQNPDS